MADDVKYDLSLQSVEDTEALGGLLASIAQRGDAIYLHGELGAGKTALSRGYMRYFFQNPDLEVPSPTYLLHFMYQQEAADEGKLYEEKQITTEDGAGSEQCVGQKMDMNEKQKEHLETVVTFKASRFAQIPDCKVHHFDPYRLKPGRIAALVDFASIFENEVALVEWPERLGDQVVPPNNLLHITFHGVGLQHTERKATLHVKAGSRWVQALAVPFTPDNVQCSLQKVKAVLYPTDKPSTKFIVQHRSLNGKVMKKEFFSDPDRKLTVLGIESSCDDTGAAVVTSDGKILGECVASQAGIHELWGGVKPDAAQEAHKQAINETVETCLEKASIDIAKDLDAIAVTIGPGLGLCLTVGVQKAMEFAAKYQKPVVKVHHMEAHAFMTRMPLKADTKIPVFPYLTLLVSGGHNMLVLTQGLGNHRILGSTLDDSVGEAFDKVSRMLGITKVPGGPHLEKMASKGDANAFNFPRPLANSRDPVLRNGCDFSYSGLKTTVKSKVEKEKVGFVEVKEDGKLVKVVEIQKADAANPCGDTVSRNDNEEAKKDTEENDPETLLRDQVRCDIAASFQRVAVQHLVERAERGIARANELVSEDDPSKQVKTLIVAGGVAANSTVRSQLTDLAEREDMDILIPPPKYCVDNGVMVAWTGLERLRAGLWDDPPKSSESAAYFCEVLPRWPIGQRDEMSANYKEEKSNKMKSAAGLGNSEKKTGKKRPASDGDSVQVADREQKQAKTQD